MAKGTRKTVGAAPQAEQEFIAKYLPFYRELHLGLRPPTTPAQEHFLAVCWGQAEPKTAHEFAYQTYLSDLASSQQPRPRGRFDAAKDKAVGIGAQLSNRTKRSAVWAVAILTNPDFTYPIEQWSGAMFNTLSDVYSKAMDGAEYVQLGAACIHPSLHRLLGGHTLSDAMAASADALPDDSLTQEVMGCFGALASDFSSVVGLPIMSLSRDSIGDLMQFCEQSGISKQWMIDLLHVNGVELISSAIPGVVALMNFKGADKERFEGLAGSLGVTALASANPFGAVVALVMLALAFHKAKQEGTSVSWFHGVGMGSLKSGVVFGATSVLGPIPVAVAIACIIAGIALKKAGKLEQTDLLLKSVQNMMTVLKPKGAQQTSSALALPSEA